MVSDSSSHVAGFIRNNPKSAVIGVIDKVAMLDWYPSYMEADPSYPLPQGTTTVDDTYFDQNKEKLDYTDCRACYIPLWAIKQNGFELCTPLDYTGVQDLSDAFEEMGRHGPLLDAWYWAQKISDKSMKQPLKRMLPTGNHDCAAKASLEYRIITEDDIEWFGVNNWNALQSELEALSGTPVSVPPAVSTSTGGSGPSANVSDRDIILELVKQKQSADKKDDKKMTLAKTQAIITWKITFAEVEEDRLIMPDITDTYEQLLDEKKSERVGILRSINAAKQHELTDSEHIIMAETCFPPLNATTCELLHDGEFAGTQADDPLQMGLTILHFKAPDLDSDTYKAYMNQACTVAAEERVEEDACKRTAKTSRPYMSGREATKEDVVAAFANFLGMADCFVVLNILDKGGPKSDIAQFAYKLAMTIKSNKFTVWVKNALKENKHHVMHSILAHFGNVFRAFISLARDIRLQNLIKDSTQKEVMYDTVPFARVMQQGWAFLHKLKDDMDMNSFSTLDIVPGTYKPPQKNPKRLRTTPGGGRGGGYNGNNNGNTGQKGDNLLAAASICNYF